MQQSSIDRLREIVRMFRDERLWRKYHKPKDLAIAISIEASELLQLFLWLTDEEIESLVKKDKFIKRVSEEIADIFIYILSMVDILNLDLEKIVLEKIEKNKKKYPVETSKGDKVKERLLRQYA